MRFILGTLGPIKAPQLLEGLESKVSHTVVYHTYMKNSGHQSWTSFPSGGGGVSVFHVYCHILLPGQIGTVCTAPLGKDN